MLKIRKKIIIFAIIFLALIVTPVGTNRYYNFLLEPVSQNTEETSQIFVVSPGETVTKIAQNLKKERLIKSSFTFRLLVSRMGISKNIQAGDFRLFPTMSSRQIAQELTHGVLDVWITLPEGLRVEEQAAKIEENLKFAANDVYAFDKNEYIKMAEEGYMFPDTYLIPKDATAKDVIDRLKSTFDQKVDQNLLESGQKNNFTPEELITLASLVERESKSSDEKPIIAGILKNRLELGMPLQVDATVQYAKGYDSGKKTWWPQISTQDYQKVKSPFNTYLVPGLPPGPIASPGIEAILAVSNPKENDYLYYLHDSDGKIHYAKTQQEHDQNIQEFLLK